MQSANIRSTSDPPVIPGIANDTLLIDLRTVLVEEEDELARVLMTALAAG